jgi:hypothetical protein
MSWQSPLGHSDLLVSRDEDLIGCRCCNTSICGRLWLCSVPTAEDDDHPTFADVSPRQYHLGGID